MAGTTPTPRERRGHPRHRCACLASCCAAAGAQQWWDGEARNISCGGFLLACDGCFGAGEIVLVRLQLGAVATVRMLTAQVTRAACQADGTWLMGCRFAPALRADELEAILEQDDDGAAP